ncbi:MAB_1171c family putative transporter [Kitasatospora sp. NPDC056327]|uniref:MAB_1171c family putative transporter n=1 Tax=Kitasatospora sp. NPDC056327 TaxID=3345785 RepID=UPI0035D5E065
MADRRHHRHGPAPRTALRLLLRLLRRLLRRADPGGRVGAWYDHRRLGPLWSALRSAVPEIELVTPGPDSGPAGRPRRDIRFALYRRIIEIRDGQLALRTHLHPGVPLWVAEVHPPDGGEEFAVVVEAAAIAAALEAARTGRRFPAGPGAGWVPHPVAAGLREEAAWLVRVAAAHRRSPVMAHVRRRVRAEPDGGGEPDGGTEPAGGAEPR